MRRPFATGLSLALLIVVADQGTKWLATNFLDYRTPLAVCPYFNLTLLHNTGAAFSLLAFAGGWQRWFFSALAILASVYIVYLLRGSAPNATGYRTGLVLILGGAIGNLIDRLRFGYVVDFIQVYYQEWSWPAFNVADSAITIGAV
ncbi:MAG: signal peptidase II, partial [Gammaproteobacteria bacterium]